MSFLFLPRFREDGYDEGADVKAGSPGQWEVRDSGTFLTVASSLDTGGVGAQPRTVTSIPNIWARALLVETALHNQRYPLRDLIVKQWQGMLAAIALADVRRFDLKVQYVKLEEYLNENYVKQYGVADPFARALGELLPEPVHVLYELEGRSVKEYNPWQELYVFLWNPPSEGIAEEDTGYRVVGISSPSTLVCPAEEGRWTGLNWYGENQRLSSPLEHLSNKEKVWLSHWLQDLIQELARPEYRGAETAKSNITQLLEEFKSSLRVNSTGVRLERVNQPAYFGTPINRGALKLLNLPIKAHSQPSNVRIIPSPQKETTAPYCLLIDPKIDEQWQKKPQEIWIYENKTLATANLLRDLNEGRLGWRDRDRGEVEIIYGDELLLKEFHFLNRENALLNTLNPEGAEKIGYEGKEITPLIPLNPRLLAYFTPSDLRGRISFNISGDNTVNVSLSIPLSGFQDDDDSPKEYHCSRTYSLKEENALEIVPALELFPDFQAPDWQEYYVLYYDRGEENTFTVEFSNTTKKRDFRDEEINYQISKLNKFPETITCYRRTEPTQPIGVIFLKPPTDLSNPSGATWKVGVDFGTSFTNIYVNANDTPKRQNLEPLLWKLTTIPTDIRIGGLIEFFMPDDQSLLQNRPASILTIRPSAQLNAQQEIESVRDGRIYIPEDSIRLQPEKPYIKTGLKWSHNDLSNRNNTELFLKNLALQITAIAKKNQVSNIEWFVSYPSAFSHTDRETYSQIWEDITNSLQQTTGIQHIPPSSDDSIHWRSESVAMAQYFVDREDKQLVYATCIDIGGGTSDISIIENHELRYQCSIQLAGYHLLTQFMEFKKELLFKLFEISTQDRANWQTLKGDKFAAKFDIIMRLQSEEFLSKKRQTTVSQNADFQQLIQLMALGTAGLYYYIGIILRVLYNEGKYKKGEITPVYLGGNGSRIFHWLATGGKFKRNSLINQLLNQMLLKGSQWQMPEAEVTSHLSNELKDEVACGLVLDHTELTGWNDETLTEDTLIAGEHCTINGQKVTPYQRMPLIPDQVNIDNFQVDESFTQLKEFVTHFNEFVEQSKAMKEVGLKPIIVENKDFEEVSIELTRHILDFRGKKGKSLRLEPAFILTLKKLLEVLGKRWAQGQDNIE